MSPQEIQLAAKYGTPPLLDPGTAYYDPNADPENGAVDFTQLKKQALVGLLNPSGFLR